MRYTVRSVSRCYSWWYSRALIGLTRNPLIQYALTIDGGNTKLHMLKNLYTGYQYRGFHINLNLPSKKTLSPINKTKDIALQLNSLI